MSFSFLRKSLVSDIKLGVLCRRGCRMESTYPEICSVSVLFYDTIGLYGGLMLRLLALSISCAVLFKLPSVMCLLALVDIRWLSDFALQRLFVYFSWRGSNDEDCRYFRKFWTLYIFYCINVFLNFPLLFHLVFYIHIYIVFYSFCIWESNGVNLRFESL